MIRGFTIRDDEISGIQVDVDNSYNVSMIGIDKPNPLTEGELSNRVSWKQCMVQIGKEPDCMENCLLGVGHACPKMDEATFNIMERMHYTPTQEELECHSFICSFEQYLKIVNFVKNIGIQ